MPGFITTQDKIEALYVGYFSRAADPGGLSFWNGVLNSGALTYTQISAAFAIQSEATARSPYLAAPTISDPGAFVDQVYTALFNRLADASGKAFWLGQLAAGNNSPATIGTFIINIITSAQGIDAAMITNKVAVGGHFTTGLTAAGMAFNAAAAAEAKAEVTATDGTLASVTTNQTRSDIFDVGATPPVPGQTFTLTPATASVNEGAHDVITLSTTNVAAGTSFNYLIGGIAAGRLTGSLTGTVVVDATGKAVIDLGVVANNQTDGLTTAVVSLTNGAASTSVVVNDTSTTPVTPVPTSMTVTLTTTVGSFVGGAGNDTFVATYSDGGANTLQVGDTLTGNGGSDTLNITPSVAAANTTLADSLWANVSGIQNVSVTTGAGAQTLTAGAAFQTAFGAGAINLTETSAGGALNINTMTFTGAETITTSSGAGAQTINTGSGPTTVTASSSTGGIVISGADLVSVTATTTGAASQTITSTGSGNVSINATDGLGAQTITAGTGNDIITLAAGAAGPATITVGTASASGTNTIIIGSHTGLDAVSIGATNGSTTAITTITGLNSNLGTSDTITFLGDNGATGAVISETATIATYLAANSLTASLANDVAAVLAATGGNLAQHAIGGFVFSGNTYLVENALATGHALGAGDTVVDLSGTTDFSGYTAAAGVLTLHAFVAGQSFTLTTGVDNFAGGAGNDTFTGTYSDGGANTFNVGDTLAGNGGTDTLNITPSIAAAATTLNDNLWTNITGIENISITTAAGVQTIVTGAAFQSAFSAGGVALTSTTTGGAINIDMTTFTGTETLVTSSGAGAQTITAGSGPATVTANSTAGAITILGSDLVSVTATTTGAASQTITSTGSGSVTVNATDLLGAQTVIADVGNDTIVIASGTAGPAIISVGTATASGTNSVTVGSHTGIDAISVGATNASTTAITTIAGLASSLATSDTIKFLGDSGATGAVVSETAAIATYLAANSLTSSLANDVTAVLAATGGNLAQHAIGGFVFSGNTYLVENALAAGHALGAGDTVVALVGITVTSATSAATGILTLHG